MWLWMIVAALACAAAWAAEEVYYARKRLQVRKAAGWNAETVGRIDGRKAVKVLDKSGKKYWLVEAGGVKGYVYAKNLSPDAPPDLSASLAMVGEQKARLSDVRPDGAIRGLTKEAEAFAHQARIPASVVQDIEYLSQVPISAGEYEEFLKDGRLGEYGGN
jgi:hypothetical protein